MTEISGIEGSAAPRRDPLPDVARTMASVAAANLLAPIAALATAPILANELGVVARGEVAGASAPFMLATAAATLGMPEAVTYFVARQVARSEQVMRRALRVVLLTGLAVAAVMIATSSWLSDGVTDVRNLIIVGAAATIPALVVGTARGLAAGRQRWDLVVRERLTSSVLRLGLILALAILGELSVVTASLVVIVVPALSGITYLRLLRPSEARPADPPVSTHDSLLGYGMRVWVGGISGILLVRLDQAIMNPLAGARELGLYAVAVAVSEVPLISTSAMRDVIFAVDAADESDARLARAARLSGLVALGIGVAICSTMPFWFTRLFGGDYEGGIEVAVVLTAAVVLGAPGSIIGAGLSSRGRPGLRSACLVVACLVNLALVLILVPDHGAMGAAIATLVGNVTAGVLAVTFLWRSFGLHPGQFYGLRRHDLDVLRSAARARLASTRSSRSGAEHG